MESHDLEQLQQEVKNVSAPLQLLRQEIGRIVSGQQELVDRIFDELS